jgi:hypothetical protein
MITAARASPACRVSHCRFAAMTIAANRCHHTAESESSALARLSPAAQLPPPRNVHLRKNELHSCPGHPETVRCQRLAFESLLRSVRRSVLMVLRSASHAILALCAARKGVVAEESRSLLAERIFVLPQGEPRVQHATGYRHGTLIDVHTGRGRPRSLLGKEDLPKSATTPAAEQPNCPTCD